MSDGVSSVAAKLVVDTCVVSYVMKGQELAHLYAPHLQGKLLAISFITVGEMYFGAENAGWGEARRQQQAAWRRRWQWGQRQRQRWCQ